MAYFVEYKRALRALCIAGVILGVFLVLAIIGRIASHNQGADAYFGDLRNSPTAHVTNETLADGSVRTIIDDPVRKVHAVAVTTDGRLHVEVTEPSRGHGSEEDNIMGEVRVHETHRGGVEHTVVDTNLHPHIPLGIMFGISILIGFIVASLLGGVLAKENDGHLELAWTKPFSRERYALAAFAVDAAAIVVSQIACVAVGFLCLLLFFVPAVTLEQSSGVHIALSLLATLGWYAALTGWSASLKRGPGIVIGLGWLFGSIVPGITELFSQSTAPLIEVIHAVLLAITYLDPLAYINLHMTNSTMQSGMSGALHLNMTTACFALAGLTVFYLAAAVAQWRRVEA